MDAVVGRGCGSTRAGRKSLFGSILTPKIPWFNVCTMRLCLNTVSPKMALNPLLSHDVPVPYRFILKCIFFLG
jgi:hypothetical protein